MASSEPQLLEQTYSSKHMRQHLRLLRMVAVAAMVISIAAVAATTAVVIGQREKAGPSENPSFLTAAKGQAPAVIAAWARVSEFTAGETVAVRDASGDHWYPGHVTGRGSRGVRVRPIGWHVSFPWRHVAALDDIQQLRANITRLQKQLKAQIHSEEFKMAAATKNALDALEHRLLKATAIYTAYDRKFPDNTSIWIAELNKTNMDATAVARSWAESVTKAAFRYTDSRSAAVKKYASSKASSAQAEAEEYADTKDSHAKSIIKSVITQVSDALSDCVFCYTCGGEYPFQRENIDNVALETRGSKCGANSNRDTGYSETCCKAPKCVSCYTCGGDYPHHRGNLHGVQLETFGSHCGSSSSRDSSYSEICCEKDF